MSKLIRNQRIVEVPMCVTGYFLRKLGELFAWRVAEPDVGKKALPASVINSECIERVY